METINDRLRRVAEYYGLFRYSDFAEKTGLPHQTVSNYLKGKQKPDVDKLAVIQRSFDEVNALWLLTGEGEMLKSGDKTVSKKKADDNFDKEREKYMWEQIRIKDEEIARLKGLTNSTKKAM